MATGANKVKKQSKVNPFINKHKMYRKAIVKLNIIWFGDIKIIMKNNYEKDIKLKEINRIVPDTKEINKEPI